MKLRNLSAYLQERFAPVNMGLFGVLFCTGRGVASVACAEGRCTPGPDGPALAALGALATVSFFFRLRVFDEEKDFALDAITHPQRVLQTGRVTLPQLRALAWGGAALELGWSATKGLDTLGLWALALGYSLLMRAEFGVGHWLRRHLVAYALSHLLIMPLVIWWLFAAYTQGMPFDVRYLPLLWLLSLLGGLGFELARKLHAPAAERAGVDSYSRALGYRPALALTGAVLLAGGAVQALLLRALHGRPPAFGVVALLLAAGLFLYSTVARRPQEARLRQAEKLVSLGLLTSYLAVLAEVYGIGR